ncbi:VOC family protein [Streptomyces nitrosporeus]|uniref:VOC family protein n=1 Tax=Streptomyces nitrosporeus TaxID=28894 RepID=A0A5J6F912_9ACTN|nr:VOC family protein [Streptomyces nitrosporeus]QEU72989.1 VOC family protein [Streptomyces nitrosporeus]GGZ14225.1 hydrolase [Streptomyces nitrosporeus]
MAAFAQSAPCWADVQLPDLEAGKRFYGGLFGWTFHAGDGMPFADAYSDGKLVAALAGKRDGRMPTAWGVYFSTDDIAATVALVRRSGGQVITDPVPAGRAGVLAQAADPGGAVFGLWQAGERAGFEKRNAPGSFCWTEVRTRRPERVDPFYEEVLGFRGTDTGPPADGTVPFRMWSPAGTEPGEDTAVGGREVLGDDVPEMLPSHFLSYFAVADCDRTAGTAVHLGGRIPSPPADTPYGRTAVLQDDQGAVFAVLQPNGRLP